MNDLGRPRPHARARGAARKLVAAVAAATTAIFFAVGVASAAPASNSQAVAVASNQANLGGFQITPPIVIPLPIPIVLTDLVVAANATWSGDITTNLGWDTDKVRQGQDLAVSRIAPLTSGKIDVKWTLTGKIDGIGFGPTNISKDNITCSPKLSGGNLPCEGSSGEIPLGSAPSGIPFPGPPFAVAMLGIGVKFDVTPEGVVVTRGFSIGGNQVTGPNDLSLTDNSQSETLSVPCSAKAGDAVAYGLDPYHWTPDTTATQQTRIRIILAYDPVGATEVGQIGPDINIGPANMFNPAFDLTGSGFLTAMGPLLANNINPTISPLGPFSGSEGTPIAFSASVTSQCPIGSYVWEFSDGTKSFGPSPQRAFGDNAVYNGQLTVTDITGLSATQSFTVSVSNVDPTVNAGPDTTADWGRLVAFNGQATDPGWGDQSTLQYTWTFGDGTPSATGGPSVLHAYASPGSYVATLEVCDKDGGCDSDSRTVVVTKRDTTLGYTGPLSSSPSKTVTLTANLVDEYGEGVPGRKVTFVLGSQSAVGTTDASGTASVSFKLSQKPGSYPLTATFPAGDAKYNDSADAGTFVIGK
jgi:PKD domain